jgi:hypothetical protein
MFLQLRELNQGIRPFVVKEYKCQKNIPFWQKILAACFKPAQKKTSVV